MYKILLTYKIKGAYGSPESIRIILNGFCYLIEDSTLLKVKGNSIEIVEFFVSSLNLRRVNEIYFFISEERNNYLYKIQSEEKVATIFFNTHFFSANTFNSDFVYFFKRTPLEKYSGIYNVLEDKIQFRKENNIDISILYGDFFFSDTNNLITQFDLNGQELWQHDLSHLGHRSERDVRADEFDKFLGVAHKQVFVLSLAGKLVVLNIVTGELVKTLTDIPLVDAFIHPHDQHLYCLSGVYFVKINTQTLQIETNKQITEDNFDPNINTILYGIRCSSYQGQYISFTSFTRHRSGLPKWIGLFDYEKEEIVWHYELLPHEGFTTIPAGETPQLVGDKIYVLDSDNTLHILEKESIHSLGSVE